MELDFAKLDRAFNPRCVAVIGDRGEKLQWLRGQKSLQGKLYSVQISPESIKVIEAFGVENYTSLLDIPDQVDLVIVSVPRAAALQVLEDCIRKGVAAAHFYTSGFAETETEEGIRLEKALTARAKEANFYVVGPNCLGLYNPKVGIRQNDQEAVGFQGPVGFISQSGTFAASFAIDGYFGGVYVNKSVSFGNGVVLDSPDYLEYFGRDDGIKVIGMYLEGVRDGKRFISVLRKVAAQKPVVIWKGGKSGQGERAIASHTGSLAIPHAVWLAAVKQCGAINVNSFEELLDTVNAMVYLPPVAGNGLGVVGGSGGLSVAISDIIAEEGQDVPPLTRKSYDELSSFFKLVGASYRNPIDTGGTNRAENKRILDILAQDENIDNLMLLSSARTMVGMRSPEEINADIELMVNLKKKTSKPVMVVIPYYLHSPRETEIIGDMIKKLNAGGVPAFMTVGRGARALKNALAFHQRKNVSRSLLANC